MRHGARILVSKMGTVRILECLVAGGKGIGNKLLIRVQ